ncbi:ubiquitin-like protein 4A [Pteropus vampyrus]|uniref:Ubiquitin-like protein 4A n=1 Tax=Pteropus vampyrus TaxID=132908 RepID=A0A6P6BN32_PTEVA|nr:ubiquitin-like protein 4A [Pteropus vampyrus]
MDQYQSVTSGLGNPESKGADVSEVPTPPSCCPPKRQFQLTAVAPALPVQEEEVRGESSVSGQHVILCFPHLPGRTKPEPCTWDSVSSFRLPGARGPRGLNPCSHPRPGQVSEDELVSTLKHLVSEKLNVPVRQQRLLFKGKALADGKRLSDYSIGPNSKLNLVVKPLEKVLLEETAAARRLAEASPPRPPAWQLIAKVLARHFSAADASRVLDQLQRDYERSLSRLTLDDIERLASRFLHPEVTEAMEKGFSK